MTERDGWMNPLNKLVFYNAIKAKAPQVTTPDGAKYRLDYKKQKGKVHITPIPSPAFPNLFVPRGFFDLKAVTDPAWLET